MRSFSGTNGVPRWYTETGSERQRQHDANEKPESGDGVTFVPSLFD